MKANEFIKMMEQDIVTMSESEKELYGAVQICMVSAAENYNGEIDGNKNLKDGYKAIENYAKENKSGSSACVSMITATKIMRKYLGIPIDIKPEETPASAVNSINLEDFF